MGRGGQRALAVFFRLKEPAYYSPGWSEAKAWVEDKTKFEPCRGGIISQAYAAPVGLLIWVHLNPGLRSRSDLGYNMPAL